ncbi:MAG: DUF427 domain-containing protein [Actinomycetota bacterium]
MEGAGRPHGATKVGADALTIVNSHAHLVVRVKDVVLADTYNPIVLLEGTHPVRYYIRPADVRRELLPMVRTTSHCPLKGDAKYFAGKIGEHVVMDIAWVYDDPVPGAERIAGMIAFYNEKVDIDIDGEPQRRPRA